MNSKEAIIDYCKEFKYVTGQQIARQFVGWRITEIFGDIKELIKEGYLSKSGFACLEVNTNKIIGETQDNLDYIIQVESLLDLDDVFGREVCRENRRILREDIARLINVK